MIYSFSYNFNSFLIGLEANVIKHTLLIITITYLLMSRKFNGCLRKTYP
jgi:hypothetical protein